MRGLKSLHYLLIGLLAAFWSVSGWANNKADSTKKKKTTANVIVVAIDPGHGGKDPGAIGASGLKEKEVTLAISKELKALLDADPNFKAVLTRNSDYFIQLPNRTEIARKNRANILVSVHADSSPVSTSLRGASVWVLSNRRASDEMGKWLEDHEKQSELLGGAGSVLAENNERYLNQTVLDLQFSHSQRVGYELGKAVLGRMNRITSLAKSSPQHASLSVLRSPDIPSILVETGFLSNPEEEQKLATKAYRRQIAQAIYNGIVQYHSKNRVQLSEGGSKQAKQESKSTKSETADSKSAKSESKSAKSESKTVKSETKTVKSEAKKSTKADKTADKTDTKNSKTDKAEKAQTTEKKVNLNAKTHIVQENETLYSIARMYKTTPEKLSALNNIKNNNIRVGQKLKLQ